MKKIFILSLALFACGDAQIEDRPANAPTDTATVDKTAVNPAATTEAPQMQPATQFDAQYVKVGDAFGRLKVAAANVKLAPGQTNVTGSVHFKGEVEIVGNYRAHFDYPEVKTACFWVDPESWIKLPRAKGDQRLVWFCFQNQDEAIEQLGALGTQSTAKIVIDDYTTNLTSSGAWDTARLVRVVEKF